MDGVFFEGFFLQAGLIFALGAQNLYVLESGLNRRHRLIVSMTCFFCDCLIIMMGVVGAGSFFVSYPAARILIGIVGVIFLFQYGWEKIITVHENVVLSDEKSSSMKDAILRSISFSVINPHAYLDGIVLIGGFSSKYSELSHRVTFGLGASIYSGLWFLLLSGASSLLRPFLNSYSRMRTTMLVAGSMLLILSAKLGIDVCHWIDEINGGKLDVPHLLTGIHIFRAQGLL